jgi:hypothetical protein
MEVALQKFKCFYAVRLKWSKGAESFVPLYSQIEIVMEGFHRAGTMPHSVVEL